MSSPSTQHLPHSEFKKKSLLERYDIPIDHLDFPYIRRCNNAVELERIIRILRSNEEGCYPELLTFAEERLAELVPNHCLLRVSSPALSKHQLPESEWRMLEEDISSWKHEVSDVERKLSQWKELHPQSPAGLPQVRSSSSPTSHLLLIAMKGQSLRKARKSVRETEEKEEVKRRPPATTDYKKWDMFDAEEECLRLELGEERQREERQRRELLERKALSQDVSQLSVEEKEIRAIAGTIDALSEEERKVLSLKEKELGNEFFQTNRLENALRHYTRSIYLYPTPASYNNRAATYLKQCSFNKALEDLNVVLEMEPNNVKAHYRRAMAYQHKNEFQKALDDIQEVLRFEPKHVLARHVADQLRENCATLPRKLRIKVRDENNPSQLVVKEVTEDILKRDYQDVDYLEVNSNGLPKIMCNCNGKYTNDPAMKSNDPLKYQHIWYQKEKHNEKIAELERNGKRVKKPNGRLFEDTASKKNKPLIEATECGDDDGTKSATGTKRLEIVELEKIDEEDRLNQARLNSAPCIVSDMRSEAGKSLKFDGETAAPFKTKDEKMIFNNEIQASERVDVDNKTLFTPHFNSNYYWENDLSKSRFGNMKTAQSPISNSSVNGEFSSDIDSDDEFPDEPPTSPVCKASIDRVERLMENDIDAICKDFFPEEELTKCQCGEGYRFKSHQFLVKWMSFESSPTALRDRGRLLRLLCPHQLSSVIGNNLDEQLLSGLISCLCHHFDPETEKDNIVKYLESIASLQRFRIIASFLSPKDRAVVTNLLKKLHPVNNDIEEAFVLQ